MTTALERKVDACVHELAAARAKLDERADELLALAIRERTAQRALPIFRDALVRERIRHPTLKQSLAQARTDRIEREEEAARALESSGGCGG